MSDIKKQTEELIERISSEEAKDPFKRLSEIAFKSYGAPRYAERLVEQDPNAAAGAAGRTVGFENVEAMAGAPQVPSTAPVEEPAPMPAPPTMPAAMPPPPPEPVAPPIEPPPPATITPGNRDDDASEVPYPDDFGVGKRDTLESEMRADAVRAANPSGPYNNLAGQARALAEARATIDAPHNIHSEAEAQQARNIRNMTTQQSEQTLEERITAELLAMLGEGSGDRKATESKDREQVQMAKAANLKKANDTQLRQTMLNPQKHPADITVLVLKMWMFVTLLATYPRILKVDLN